MDAYHLHCINGYEGYQEMASQEPQRWRIISLIKPIEVVQSELRDLLSII